MPIKKVLPNHMVESADTSIPVGKGTDLSKLNGNSFVGLVPYTELGTGGGGVVSSVNVDYVGTTLTVTVDGVSDNSTIASGANLTYTPSPTNGIVVSDSGTDATIPVVNGTNAGLATPTMFTNSHVPVTVTDSNSIDFTLTGQDVTAKIAGITSATNGQVAAKGAGDTIVWTTLSGGTPSNLALGTATATTQPITNSNGTGVTLPSATLTTAGLTPSTDFQKLAIQTLTDGATVTLNANNGNYALWSAAGDRTFAAPTNTVNGEQYTVVITATGADRTITFNSVWKKPDGTDFGSVVIPNGQSRAYMFVAGPAVLHQIGGTTSTSTSNTVATVNGGRFTYQVLSGTPVLTFDKSNPLTPTLTVAGGTIRLIEVRDTIVTATSVNPVYTFNATWADAIDVDPSFITKKTVSSGQFDIDNTPQVIVSTTGTTQCVITINAVASDMKFIIGWNNV